MRDRLKRLQKLAEVNIVSIPQPDGPPARFPESELAAAYVNACRRTCGEDVPEHALSTVARNSLDPKWRDSVVAGVAVVPEPPEDLSE